MTEIQLPSEEHLKYHRQQWWLYLLYCSVMAVGGIASVLTPGSDPGFVLWPALIVLAIMTVFGLVVRRRHRASHAREMQRIVQDEWTHRCLDRARGVALLTVIFLQVPLMPVMEHIPEEPSIVGMGVMTIAVGCGTVAAAFLYFSRADARA